MDTDEFVEEIIAVLLSILASIFSLSTFPALLEGDMSWPAPPAKNRTHFFFRLEKNVSSEIQPRLQTVRIFTYSSTREQSNKRSGMRLKQRARLGRDAKNTDCPFCIRYIRSNYPLLPATGNSHWLL